MELRHDTFERSLRTMPEKIVTLNEEAIKKQLMGLARGSVEEKLNELLEVEAEKLAQAAQYECYEQRHSYCSCHYNLAFCLMLFRGREYSVCPNTFALENPLPKSP